MPTTQNNNPGPVEDKLAGGKAAVQPEPTAEAVKKPTLTPLAVLGKLIGWGILAALVVFAAGALIVYTQFYTPKVQELNLQTQNLEQAQKQIKDMEEQVRQLTTVQEKVAGLETELAQTHTLNALLRTRTDIAMALAALGDNDPVRAKAALSQTSQTLEVLASGVTAEQRAFVDNMQKRLSQSMTELDSDLFAAESDLNVLLNSLLELETQLNR